MSVAGIAITGTDAGNYTFNNTASTSADITARALVVSAAGVNKIYDATATATVTLSDNRVSGDVFTAAFTTATFDNKNVGSGKTVSVSGLTISGADALDYTFNPTATTTANITVRALVVTATGVNKIYDGTTAASVTLADNRVAGDAVTDNYAAATFDTKNVGTGKTVTVSGISLGGTDGGNYAPNTSATTAANITTRALTITATAANRVYDATTAASVALANDRVSGDMFTDTYTAATFADKNVGTAKPVSVAGIAITGTNALNYTFNATALAAANITPATLTGSFTASDKVYDGNAAAVIAMRSVAGTLASDVVNLTGGAATFADKNVGTGKTVTGIGFTLGGGDAPNYVLQATTLATTASITRRTLTITATGVSKVYDATTAATVTLTDDRLSGDVVTDSYTSATFADKNVGTAKAISVAGISISGGDAGNYTANATATTAANITPATVVGSITADNKTYDGTNVATIATRNLTGVLLTDVVSLTGGTATFSDKNVANGKTVTAIAFTLSGGDATNYILSPATITTTANITPKSVTGTFTANNKEYDGTTAATIATRSLAGTIAGDDIALNGGTATFSDKNAATAKVVSGVGFGLAGTDALNYSLASSSLATTADITPRLVTVTADAKTKVYGTSDPALTNQVTTGSVVTGDGFTGVLSRAPGETVLGSPYAIQQNTLTLGTNYTISYVGASLTITPATVTGQFTAANKVYDRTNAATIVTRTLTTGVVGSDNVMLTGGSATFSDKNVANGKTVTATGFTLGGSTATNYVLASTSLTTMADITPRPLVVTALGVNKVYDATTAASATLSDDRLAGDVISAAYATAAFNNKNVGTAKPISVAGITITGADALNYAPNATASATADVTAATATGHITASDKTYDGTAVATITGRSLTGILLSDVVTLDGGTASFSDKTAANGKTVTGTGLTLGGLDAPNYILALGPITTTANINTRALTVTATGANKVYDGNNVATVVLADNRVSGDVLADSYSSATFDNKNVGNNKPISVSAISISGADAGNYTFNTTASAMGNVTARALTVSAAGINKVYDGNASATVTLSDDRVSGDVLATAYTTAAFSDKNAATAKSVTVNGISVTGTDAGNYSFNTTTTTTADITKRGLTITAAGINKVYDGATAAAVTLADNRVAGDAFSDGYAAANFDDKNVGVAKPVSVSGISISGTDAGNYSFNTTASTNADITRRALTIAATGVDRVYDGTANATVTLTDNRVAGDVLADSYSSASFADKNAGIAKTVNVSGLSIAGGDANNYTFNAAATTTATITRKALTVSATGIDKVYDGNTTAAVTLTDNRVSGDVLTLAYSSALFGDKTVGATKPVTVSGIDVTGTDAVNYTFNATASTSASITARALTIAATGVNKVYDGTAAATVTLSDNRVVGDVFADSYASAAFNNANAGVGKSVSVSGISISGVNATNYTFNTTATTSADIAPKPIGITAVAKTKVYGDPDPGLTYTMSSTLVSPSDLTGDLTRTSGETVGTYTIGQGTLALTPNYALTYVGANFSITKRALTVTADDKSKIAGGVNPPLTGVIVGALGSDNITANYSTTAVTNSLPNTYPITPALVDPMNRLGNYSVTPVNGVLTVTPNAIPSLGTVVGPIAPTALGTPVQVSVPFTDTDVPQSQPYTATISWGDGNTSTSSFINTGTITGSRVYTQPGVYVVTVTIKQNNFPTTNFATKTLESYVVVYDPSAGFVTGGGWIMSPVGACMLTPDCQTSTGKANFGFNAKYKKGASTPDGDTEFQFQAGNLNFKATVYDWLVINGPKAQYQGNRDHQRNRQLQVHHDRRRLEGRRTEEERSAPHEDLGFRHGPPRVRQPAGRIWIRTIRTRS